MVTLENELLKVVVSPAGAELQSIVHKENGLEYLWQGDAAYWGKRSPVLFPIVGGLKDGIYYFKDQVYSVGRHGFARDKNFEVREEEASRAVFTLRSGVDTLLHFPFDFEFSLVYELQGDRVSVSYHVANPDGHTMYFSVGGHPAFNVPLVPGTDYTDYYLLFNKKETAGRWPLSPDGLIEKEPVSLLNDSDHLPLTKELFAADAVVLKNLRSDSVRLLSNKHSHGLQFEFPDFPYLGIWAAKGADFVCIEPWCGIADAVDTDQLLENKEGIVTLESGSSFIRQWAIRLF